MIRDSMTAAGGEAFAQWVRRAVRRARHSHPDTANLFGSSVEEPVELLRRTVEAGFSQPITSRYTSVFVSGNPYVMEQLSSAYGVDPSHILPTTGATGALSLLYRAYLAPGDHVLVESPGFDLFTDIARACHAEVDHFERPGEGFDIVPEEIERRIQPNTRLIVLTNLHNPSGMLVSDDTLRAVAAVAARHGIKVIVDEVYGGYATPDIRTHHAAQLSPELVSVSSLTKIYGLSTLRCGWIVADPEVLAPVRALADQFEFGVSKLSHAVAALVLEDSATFDSYWQGVMRDARPVMQAHFDRWRERGLVTGRMPEHGCIAFPRLAHVDDTVAFSNWLADQLGVIVVPGELFGAAGHVRIGFALPAPELEDALGRFTEGLETYPAPAAKPSLSA